METSWGLIHRQQSNELIYAEVSQANACNPRASKRILEIDLVHAVSHK